MKRLSLVFVALLLLLAGGAHAQCTSSESAMLFFYPVAFEDAANGVSGCGEGTLASIVLEAADRIAVPESNLEIEITSSLGNNPARLTDVATWLASTRLDFIMTHGNTEGVVMEYFSSGTAAQNRLTQYTTQMGIPADWIDVGYSSSGSYWFLILWRAGINGLFKPVVHPEAILGLHYCQSYSHRNDWVSSLSSASGPTVFAYDLNCLVEADCSNFYLLVSGLGCLDYPQVQATTEAAWQYTENSLQLLGNRQNRWRCTQDCDWFSAVYRKLGFFDGAVHWTVSNEQSNSKYYVDLYRGTETEPTRVGPLNGKGTDGADKLRSYTLPVGGEYSSAEIIEIDNRGITTRSERIERGAKPHSWPAVLPDEAQAFTPPEEPASGVFFALQEDGNQIEVQSSSIEPADVLVYSDNAHAYLLGYPLAQARTTTAPDGVPFRAVALSGGSSTAADAKAAYQAVVSANAAANAACPTCRPYPVYPQMVVVGNVYHSTWQDLVNDSCRQPYCRSWSRLTDLNNNGIPDEGAVTVIPSTNLMEVINACNNAVDWNANRWVEPHGSTAFFLDDNKGTFVPWFEGEFGTRNAASYEQYGIPVKGVFTESDYPVLADAKNVGTATINSGIRYLWVSGVGTGQDNFTHFLWDESSAWITKQRMVVFGPGCELTATFWPESIFPSKAKAMLFGDPEGTVAASIVGQINAGYGSQHQAFNEVLANEILNAPRGITFAELSRRAAMTLSSQYPVYASGVIALGGLTLTKGDLSITGVGEGGRNPEFSLAPISGGGNGKRLMVNLPGRAQIDLSIFDVQGRKVATVTSGTLEGGSHFFSWFPEASSSSSGVYFARLTAAGELGFKTASAKIVLAK